MSSIISPCCFLDNYFNYFLHGFFKIPVFNFIFIVSFVFYFLPGSFKAVRNFNTLFRVSTLKAFFEFAEIGGQDEDKYAIGKFLHQVPAALDVNIHQHVPALLNIFQEGYARRPVKMPVH